MARARERHATYDVFEPATGETLERVPESGSVGVAEAIERAEQAMADWRAIGPLARAEIIRAFARELRKHADTLAATDSRNGGFPLWATPIGVDKGIQALEFFAGLAPTLTGQTIPASRDHLHYTVRQPYGLVGVLTAYNHPSLFALARIAAALIAGNCVIHKPAPQTPLSAMRIAAIAADILPPGVLQVVTGGVPTGEALIAHPDVGRIAFTGNIETALKIQHAAASSGVLKRISFQLGGKNPLVVLPDADLERAVDGAVEGMNLTRVAGQSCGSTSRAFIHRTIHRDFMELLVERFQSMRLGLPDEDGPIVGPLISAAHRDRVERYIGIGRAEGARLIAGGGRPGAPFDRGFYVTPTLFDDVDPTMQIARDEIFGPVLSVIAWDDEDEMLDAVNSVRYGLTASIYTNDLRSAHRLADRIDAGYVWINSVERRWIGVPFGGFKDSGTATEYSADELIAFSQLKAVSVALN